MNINNKHLVINSVSIFLALALGIFIGLVMSSGNLIETGTGDVIAQIEEQFKYLKEENQRNKEEINRANDANYQLDSSLGVLSGKIMQNQLTEKKVAVISLTNDFDYSGVKNTLEKAGASITSYTTMESGFYKDLNPVSELVEKTNGEKLPNSDVYTYCADNIVRSILSSEKTEIFNSLLEKGYIKYEDIGYVEGLEGAEIVLPDSIVILGGSKAELKNLATFESKILEDIRNSSILTVGVENTDVKLSSIDKFKEYNFSTVKNAETNIGKLSMILALKGYGGNYGSTASEDTQVPDLTLLD